MDDKNKSESSSDKKTAEDKKSYYQRNFGVEGGTLSNYDGYWKETKRILVFQLPIVAAAAIVTYGAYKGYGVVMSKKDDPLAV